MLDAALTAQLKTYLANIRLPVELVASAGEGARSREMLALLDQIAALHPDIRVVRADDDARRPSFLIRRTGSDIAVRFAGIPTGHEFTSLVLALLQVGGHPPKLSAETIAQIAVLDGEYRFESYFSLTCQNCPDVVQALNVMSIVNPRIRHVAIEGGAFPDEVAARQIMSVPAVFLNGEPFAQGRMSVEEILARLDTGAAARAAEAIAARAPFEVLVVGGGPAGAAAAIYAARKGIRTGIVAERLGGQTLDTMGIENFVSVRQTEGPRFAAALEQHVGDYDVDIMTNQRAVRLDPASGPAGLHRVTLAGGATLAARTVIVATGARWRTLGVPGEDTYRNKGVTYCPHCDGPLFRGKRVAVVGGGNSGVEAAIDLAGVAAHVTLVEFADTLRADEVLRRRLASLANVDVLTSAMTTEVLGDGARVTGLAWRDRRTDSLHRLALDGVFVQIGLVPNTDWLGDTIALSACGEVEVDAHGATTRAGVFAAGDCTTTPYKQIIVAAGDGARASLAAFDHLIRLDPATVVLESEAA